MDRALFLTHEQVSHAHDTFFNGMMLLLGRENVFDYPCVEKNHSDYKNHGHTYAWWCYNDLGHVTSLSLDDWAKEIDKGNIKYVIGSNRGYAIENLKLLISKIKNSSFQKCTFVFLEEEEDPGFDAHRWFIEHIKLIYNKIDIHYKVDYIKNKVCSYDKIYPFYLSAPYDKIMNEIIEVKPFKDRRYDVCFVAGNSHQNREKYFNILKNLKLGNNIIEFGAHKYSLNQYFNIINDSKIFISVRGNGWSNTRNVEGPVCGAALFSEEIEISIPNEYSSDENAIFFNEKTIIPLLEKYINSDNLNELAKNSRNHCINNHTSIQRAKQFIELSKKIKGCL